MTRKTLSFIALAISMFYGIGFAIFQGNVPTAYTLVGAVLVALAWIAVGKFGRSEPTADIEAAPQDRV